MSLGIEEGEEFSVILCLLALELDVDKKYSPEQQNHKNQVGPEDSKSFPLAFIGYYPQYTLNKAAIGDQNKPQAYNPMEDNS